MFNAYYLQQVSFQKDAWRKENDNWLI